MRGSLGRCAKRGPTRRVGLTVGIERRVELVKALRILGDDGDIEKRRITGVNCFAIDRVGEEGSIGEELFEKASSSDAGLFNDAENDRLIEKTLTASPSEFIKTMWTWENYLSPDLPVVYEPNVPTLVESVANLHIGVQAPTLNINPEDWYYLK